MVLSNGMRMALAAGAGAVLFAAIIVIVPQQDAPAPDAESVARGDVAQTTEPETAAPDAEEPESPAPEPAASDAVAPATSEPVAGAADADAAEPPRIETVYIEPDGSSVIAGRAAAGATVAVMLGATVLTEVSADAAGQFVALLSLEPSDQPRELSLVADPAGDAVASAETYLVAPIAGVVTEANVETAALADPAEQPADPAAQTAIADPDADEPVVAAPDELIADAPEAEAEAEAEAADDVAGTVAPAVATVPEDADAVDADAVPDDQVTDVEAASTLSPVVDAPQPEPAVLAPALAAPDEADVAAPPVLIADAQGVRVLQPALAPGATPEVLTTVALDAISYDDSGEVALTGRATGGGFIRVYIDNAPVSVAPVDAAGQWQIDLRDIEAGVYTMRVDQVDADGAVMSRIETPFLREERDSIAATMADQTAADDFNVAILTVQPGNTLWAIARDRYGEGLLYVNVFDANRDRIRNPDLIYPGQVFVLPEMAATAQPSE